MCDNGSPLEETGGSDTLGSVDDLGWNSEVSGSDLFTEGTNCGKGEDGANA